VTDESPATTFAVIAGGGTAGHALPGVAVGQALVAAGRDPSTILFIGSERGVEGRMVPAAGFPFIALPGRGIARRLTLDNVGAAFGLLRALGKAFALLRARRPRVVLSLGGYASVACVAAAAVLRIPVVVTEQNATAGLATRLAGRVARACAVPFPGVDLPRAVVTGNPVRTEVAALADPALREAVRLEARAALGVEGDRPLVLVMTGSLGAQRVNLAVAELLGLWQQRPVAVCHITGTRDFEMVLARVGALSPSPGGLEVHTVAYEDHVERLLAAADVAVCRSGGTTVAELAVAGLPAVLVPMPTAPRDHQRANATPLVAAGGAVLLDDEACSGSTLDAALTPIVADPQRQAAMAAALRSIGRPLAAAAVAALVEEHARVA
jgi:undecaprenyldiphospho-muramoylpentapeptide beta-N-acetylglucosaminyltransferase